MMQIDIDIGNSRIKWRIRHHPNSCERGYLSPADLQSWLNNLPWAEVAQLNLASVAKPELVAEITESAAQHSHLQLFVAQTEKQFGRLRNGYVEHTRLGVDRLLAMVGALEFAHGAFCVIDCGTAITLDFVGADGLHLGGYIVPGIELQRRMLMQGTYAVRTEDEMVGDYSPGHSTAECALRGIRAIVRAGVQAVLAARAKTGVVEQVILTGGDATLLVDLLPDAVVVPDLVLDGLAELADKQN